MGLIDSRVEHGDVDVRSQLVFFIDGEGFVGAGEGSGNAGRDDLKPSDAAFHVFFDVGNARIGCQLLHCLV